MPCNRTDKHDRTVYPVSPIPAIAVMVTRGDEVLMIKRGKAPRKGTWTVPGGSIELGETLAQAAIREVMEETSVRIEPGPPFTAVDAIYHDNHGKLQFHYTIIYIEAIYLNGTARAMDDAADIRWVKLGELNAGFPDAEPGTLKILQKKLGIIQESAA